MFKYCFLSIFIAVLFLSKVAYAEDIRIALRSHQDIKKGLAQWQATADYLSKKIPGYRFTMVPFTNISAMNQAISSGDFHFSLTNPSSAIEYIKHYDAEPLATLVNKRQGKGYSEFGSVIFTRVQRKDIKNLKDLKGKTFVAVDEQAFGGWRVAWLELLKNKINPFTDFKLIRFAGGKQQDVVFQVLHGKADAGTVRTDMLERMAEKEEINLKDFKIIGEKKSSKFPFKHSTNLYPEWLFSTAGKVNNNLKDKVVQALLSISASEQCAIAGKYIKWIKPLDYTPVDDLLKELKVGPYNVAIMDVYKSFILQYGTIAVVTIVVILILFFSFLYVLSLNRQILLAKESLKDEIEIRGRLERQLVHSQRIESLGLLTGGIAHNFNNILASVSGYAELALQNGKVKGDDKLTEYISQIMTAGERCASLVSQMLVFSKSENDIGENENISVSNLLVDINQLLQPTLSGNINLKVKGSSKDLTINANATMITQVIMNLFLNAKDAIADNEGVIVIGADVAQFNPLDVHCVSCHQEIRGNYISISIQDTGCGIRDEDKEHLFDPFYSTKEVGKGTGMGLSVVHGIMHKHEGHILVDSQVDEGATITILFPQVIGKVKFQPTNNTVVSSNKLCNYIMIVDDEISLTVYLSELLKQNDYKTIAFNTSQEALNYFKLHSDEIDLVITDQTMPDFNGTELADKMMAFSDNTPVILCSGYNEVVDEKMKSELNIRASISKPIKSNELLKNINLIFN